MRAEPLSSRSRTPHVDLAYPLRLYKHYVACDHSRITKPELVHYVIPSPPRLHRRSRNRPIISQSCSKSNASHPSRKACGHLRIAEPKRPALCSRVPRAALKRQIQPSNMQRLWIELLPRSYDLPACNCPRLLPHFSPIFPLSAFRIRSTEYSTEALTMQLLCKLSSATAT